MKDFKLSRRGKAPPHIRRQSRYQRSSDFDGKSHRLTSGGVAVTKEALISTANRTASHQAAKPKPCKHNFLRQSSVLKDSPVVQCLSRVRRPGRCAPGSVFVNPQCKGLGKVRFALVVDHECVRTAQPGCYRARSESPSAQVVHEGGPFPLCPLFLMNPDGVINVAK
jgi:hypothetical protein